MLHIVRTCVDTESEKEVRNTASVRSRHHLREWSSHVLDGHTRKCSLCLHSCTPQEKYLLVPMHSARTTIVDIQALHMYSICGRSCTLQEYGRIFFPKKQDMDEKMGIN